MIIEVKIDNIIDNALAELEKELKFKKPLFGGLSLLISIFPLILFYWLGIISIVISVIALSFSILGLFREDNKSYASVGLIISLIDIGITTLLLFIFSNLN